jgi:UDP-N-acetylmuramoyl-tripeptide--D-alanyl-D-alanine ligase
MGANHQKEIERLCLIARPDFGLITNIGKAHLEGFGGEEGVLKGKGEMYDYLRNTGGTAFINGDDEKLTGISQGVKTITYGYGGQNSVSGKFSDQDIFLSMQVTAHHQTVEVHTQLTGKYNGINVLCAYAIGVEFNVDKEAIKKGIEAYHPDNNRSQVQKTVHNTLILDAYNANPSSMALAIENLARIKATKKMFVLGDMREMGEYARNEHLNILKKVSDLGLNGIFVGEEFSFYKNQFPFQFFLNAEEAKKHLEKNRVKDHVVLIKGSRGIKLEQVTEVF